MRHCLSLLLISCCMALVVMVIAAPPAEAYETYSAGEWFANGQSYGNCNTCHNNFRDEDYVSAADGRAWAVIYTEVEETEPAEELGLHDIHRHVMVDKEGSSRCSVCHKESGAPARFYPVRLSWSGGGEGLEPIGCVGCHGRNEDAGNDSISAGLGAGLRQHHTRARVKECMTCHEDANPENYTPVGEDVLPSYYAAPNDIFVNKPTDPCNQRGDEDYAGGPKGLDNDGDHRYDKSDLDCQPTGRGNNNGRNK